MGKFKGRLKNSIHILMKSKNTQKQLRLKESIKSSEGQEVTKRNSFEVSCNLYCYSILNHLQSHCTGEESGELN